MILCSCRALCTKKIKECLDRMPNPTVKSVIKELGWEPECATCAKELVKEIKSLLEKNNG